MRLVSVLLAFTLLGSAISAHLSDVSLRDAHSALSKRWATSCHHTEDCPGGYGGRPKCSHGKCSLECCSKDGFKLSKDHKQCIKSCAHQSHCPHAPPHGKATCNSHGHCDFKCNHGYVKSPQGTYCVRECKWDSSCTTHVANARAICLPSKACGFTCNKNYRLSKDGSSCEFHCSSNSACHKGKKTGICHKVTGKCSYPPPTTTTTQSTSTTTTTTTSPSSTPTPSCNSTTFTLAGVSEYAFNKAGMEFSLKLACANLNTNNYTVLANGVPVLDTTSTPDSITLSGLTDAYVLLSVYALNKSGKAMFGSFALLFGGISKAVIVLDSKGQPAPNVPVTASATIYPGVLQSGITDSTGTFVFTNLIGTTLSLVAHTADNQIGVGGIASTDPGDATLTLVPFGGSSATVKREDGFTVNTAFSQSLQLVTKLFKPHPFTKTAYLNYIFQTDEVPGGYFGSQFNDYFSITIRSDLGGYTFYTESMNALGLAAFDAGGTTGSYTLTLDVTGANEVEFDVGVSNVGDALYQSQVIVNNFGDLTCDKCDDTCADCPGDPMCQPSCVDPPPKTCSFYRSCAEAKMPCHADGYALGYGEHFCNKFTANIGKFTPGGQDWVFKTMTCLQKALIPILTCGATCPGIATAAFDSHPGCYVASGVCDLDPADWVEIAVIVGGDPQTYKSLIAAIKQAVETGVDCAPTLLGRFADAISELEKQAAEAITDAAKKAIQATINVFDITRLYIEDAINSI